MLLDSPEPISAQCARTVEQTVDALLRLGVWQQEVTEQLSRALGIVRCTLDYHKSIPRQQLLTLGRALWKRIGDVDGISAETVERVRSMIQACVAELRRLPEPNGQQGNAEETETDTALGGGIPMAQSANGGRATNVAPPKEGRTARREGAQLGGPIRPSTSRPQRGRHDAPRRQPTLFDLMSVEPVTAEEGQEANGATVVSAQEVEANGSCALPARPVAQSVLEPLVRIASGEKGKAHDALAAIRALKAIECEQRAATPGERQTLGRFPGFGPIALSIFPDPVSGCYKDASWRELGEELKHLVSAEEYESAKRTTFNAFYTSPAVITVMHEALDRLGVLEDSLVLEPGCGVGNFMSLAPRGMRFVGIELDSISGRIARALHPNQDIRIENFRDTRLAEGSVDAVIGNVPFADVKLEHGGQKFSLHDYFFAKSADALRPGGVLGLVTSHFTLDKQNAAIREYLASKADFVGAIRLPSDAFKREGTAVVTDILFLRKRTGDGDSNHADPDWLALGPLTVEGVEIPVNRYFLNHPEMVLGTWTRKDRLYGGEGYSVAGNGDLGEQLRGAVQLLPRHDAAAVSPRNGRPTAPLLLPPLPHIGEGSFVVGPDGGICQCLDGQIVAVVYGRTKLRAHGSHTGKRLAALIRLRDHARRVLQSQNEGWSESRRSEARRELNGAYDRFTCTYGPINKTTISETADGGAVRRMPNLVKFREDPDAMLVMSLENYDETTGKASKAAIMKHDVVGRARPVTSVGSAEEGLLVSLDQRGTVDLAYVADLYGKPVEQVTAELGDLVFQEPESKAWQTADQYLSGNVRAKLAAVLGAGQAFARNAEALREVQPEDVLPGDIDANLGAPWIPAGDVQSFAADLFHVEPASIEIGHLKQEAVWSVAADYAAQKSVAATSEYGTARANGTWLLELALNMRTPVIYDTVMVGGREDRVVNQEATLAGRDKQRNIKERFRAWAFGEPERTERLVRLYNDTYNNLRLRAFDGSHLDFPGMNQTLTLRAHQRDAVWRCMTSGNTLLAQTVGAGKTFIMAATGMKMRRAGLIRKPLFVVPNHMLEQFGREFMQLYPNAKLLIAGKDDLARQRRKVLTAKIASGDWDGVIVTHSSFERIGMSRGYQERFLKEQIREYDRLLRDGAGAAATSAQRNLIKTIEKQKARREERLKELLAEDKKDDGLVFDELGIDYLFVDEAQYYKNLETPTKMERVAGIQTGGSERAFDLYMKSRYLHEMHPGRGVTFATGTPISNTMVEMYTMQRYLDPDGMQSRGIDHFDGWAATFGEVVDTMEIAPDGKTLRPRSRFARFTNLPELQQLFRAFSDVQTAEMLDLPRPRLEGGKPAVVACPMSEEQRALQQKLVARYERIRSTKVDPRDDNALAITTDGRKLALDARLLSAKAQDFAGSKVNALVEKVASIWQRMAASRGTQMLFCDMGVHPTPWGYSVYQDIIGKLIARGIPPAEIAMMGDADSDAKKQALFERVRSGQVRVLLGSTQKMGTGTNVQKRLVALHHLDAPWKPAEVEQREGRILRQGNENEEVSIFRYVTEGSFDAYMWQALETKARFIAQVMTGESVVRRAEDIGGQELSYAEVKAIASGNPAVLTLAEADGELQRLAILKRNHADEQYVARRNLRELPDTIARLSERLAQLSADMTTAAAHAADAITIGKRAVSPENVVSELGDCLADLPPWVRETRRVPLGMYRGLRFGLVLHPQGVAPELYLDGAAARISTLSRDHHGPRAILNGLERLVGAYESDCARIQQDIVLAQGQQRDYEARLGMPFVHEYYLSELATLRDQLKAALSSTGAEPNAGVAAELAEKVKALKGAQTIDGTPQRMVQRRGSMEEPVTARIRRRLDSLLKPEGRSVPSSQ